MLIPMKTHLLVQMDLIPTAEYVFFCTIIWLMIIIRCICSGACGRMEVNFTQLLSHNTPDLIDNNIVVLQLELSKILSFRVSYKKLFRY